METMSIAPEQVEAPAADAVLFRSSPMRTFVAVFVLLMVVVRGGVADRGAAGRRHREPVVAHRAGGRRDRALAAGGYAWSTRGALTTWVRVSSGGLELAAQGSDPILLAWPDIATVVVRRAGLRTVLDVTPVDLDRVHPGAGRGRRAARR